MNWITIRGNVTNEWYQFVLADEDEDYWYTRSGVRFPKSAFDITSEVR